MDSLFTFVIALIVIVIIWKIFKGIVRTFGLVAVLIAAAVYLYSVNGGFG